MTHTSKTAVVELMRIAWRTVGAIAGRVVADGRAARDPFDGLTRIGIDEISYRRGHQYLMVVVDHDTGRLVWAKAGHDRATLQESARSSIARSSGVRIRRSILVAAASEIRGCFCAGSAMVGGSVPPADLRLGSVWLCRLRLPRRPRPRRPW